MERLRQKDITEFNRALYDVYAEDGKMLQFTAEDIRLLQFVETGKTEHRTIRAGDQEHVFNVPVKESVVASVFNTFDEYAQQVPEHARYDDGLEHTITHPDYLEWKANLPDATAFKEAAQEILADDNEGETLTCGNCQGRLVFTRACSCTEGSIHYHDMTDGTSLSDAPEDGEPNSDCGNCHGSGEISNNCPMCNGAGYMMKYPRLRFINQETGEESLLTLNIAQLVVNDDVEVELVGFENVYENGDIIAEKGWMFRVDKAVKKALDSINIDAENAAVVGGRSAGTLRSEDERSRYLRWQLRSGEISISSRRQDVEELSPRSIVEDVQGSVAHSHAWTGLLKEELDKEPKERETIALNNYGKLINQHGIAIEDVRVMKPLRSAAEAFNDLMDAITTRGFTLGYSLSFIATGEAGPSFYLLNQEGKVITQLSNDYIIRDSVENAWLAFQKVCERLDQRG